MLQTHVRGCSRAGSNPGGNRCAGSLAVELEEAQTLIRDVQSYQDSRTINPVSTTCGHNDSCKTEMIGLADLGTQKRTFRTTVLHGSRLAEAVNRSVANDRPEERILAHMQTDMTQHRFRDLQLKHFTKMDMAMRL
jgi:hypothetical protein